MKCIRCKAAFYCDAECQLDHWETHKPYCNLATKRGHGKFMDENRRAVREDKGAMSKEQKLIKASASGHIEIVRSLIAGGVNVNSLNSIGWSAIMVACQYGHLEIVRALVAANANLNLVSRDRCAFPLILASQNNHIQVVNHLFVSGANVNYENTDGFTALMKASQYNSIEVVSCLIAAGACLEAVNTDGWTSLMMASQNGHVEVVTRLTAAGARQP